MDDFPTLLDLAEAIKNRSISPTEVLDETLRRIDERNPAINAVIWHDPEDAARRAQRAEEQLTAGGDLPPFLGVPIGIKDLDDVAGWPTTHGSEGASTEPRATSAMVVDKFVEAGFVLVGRTNTPEFGSITAAENTRYGTTRNPWNLDHTPGGSSGGASASTAAGIYAAGHANDGGGSIRIPASCCGLVGHKASRGLVVTETQQWEGASVQGSVTRTVADTAALLDVIGVHDPLAWWNAPGPHSTFAAAADAVPRPLRVAMLTEAPMGLPVDPECATATEQVARSLESAGHTVVDVEIDFAIDAFMAGFSTVVNGALATYDGVIDWSKVEAHNRLGRESMDEFSAAEYVKAVDALQQWNRVVVAQWGRDFDVLVCPTMSIQPAPAGQILAETLASPSDISPTLLASVLFTAVFNMNGLPATSVPAHVAADTGLPIGVQIVGPPFGDELCLSLANQLEQAIGWQHRHVDLATLTGSG